MTEKQQYLYPKQAAAFLGLSPATLAKYRMVKSDLKFCKFGSAVRYEINDLIEYAQKQKRTHTGANSNSQ